MPWNLADLLEAVADTVPDRKALVCVASEGRPEVRLTHAQLEERSTRLAHVLADRGVGPGDHVALHLHNGNEYLEGMLAAFKLRAVPVNVNYRYTAAELRYLLEDSDSVAVVHEPDFAGVLDDATAGMAEPPTRLPIGDDYEAALAAASPERDFGPRSGDDHYILYTGGTTGMPKGVVWRQEDIFFAALGGGRPGGDPLEHPDQIRETAARGRTRCLPASPFMHGSAHWMALSTLLAGGTVVTTRARRLDPAHLWDLVDAEAVSFLVIVGDAFARPLADALAAAPGRWDLGSLTVVLSGGAVLSPALKAELGSLLPSAIVVDGFGASETGGQGQMVSGGSAPASGPPRFRMDPDTTVLDDDLRPLRRGDNREGWLARRGRIPLGYHNDPERTARTFPVVDGVRWAVPGDRARLEADGTITVLGRGSVSINTGGEKVFPEEVEAALKAHPDVLDAVVVGVPDDRWGERVCAVIRPRPGHPPPDADDLARHCRGRLAGYKTPRAVVVVDELVRSPSGKADYRWARAVAAGAGRAGRPYP